MANGQQPLHSRFDLASSPSAVRWGRKHTAEMLATWGVAEGIADDALLIVSELLSNAVQHASNVCDSMDDRSDPMACSLLLWLTENGLTVSVYDRDRRPPVLRKAHSDAERGRGLHLVEALSETWGYTHPPAALGKLVWARLTLPQAPAADCRPNLEATAHTIAPVDPVVMSA